MDDDCLGAETCKNGRCAIACVRDDECAASEVCRFNRCEGVPNVYPDMSVETTDANLDSDILDSGVSDIDATTSPDVSTTDATVLPDAEPVDVGDSADADHFSDTGSVTDASMTLDTSAAPNAVGDAGSQEAVDLGTAEPHDVGTGDAFDTDGNIGTDDGADASNHDASGEPLNDEGEPDSGS